MSVDDCVIETSVTSGIEAVLAANQTLRLRNCSVRNNKRHGVFAKGSTGTYAVDTDNCTFTSNDFGVYIYTGDVRLRMSDCKLINNHINFMAFVTSGVVNIDECFFGRHRDAWKTTSTAVLGMSNNNRQKASTATKSSNALTTIVQ